jgi:hypothetical protein
MAIDQRGRFEKLPRVLEGVISGLRGGGRGHVNQEQREREKPIT